MFYKNRTIYFKLLSLAPNSSSDYPVEFMKPFAIQVAGESISGKLYCPFHVDLNPHTEVAQLHSVNWAINFGLMPESGRIKLNAAKFGHLAGYCYQKENQVQLELVSDILTWLFLHDDRVDHRKSELSKDPDQLKSFNDALMAIFNGKKLSKDQKQFKSDPLLQSLGNIKSRLYKLVPKSSYIHLRSTLERYFRSTIDMASRRKFGEKVSLVSYPQSRRYTSAVEFVLELGWALRKINISDSVRRDMDFIIMMENTNNHICFINDQLSLNKELELEDSMENIVKVIKQDQPLLPWQKVFDEAIELSNIELFNFQQKLEFRKSDNFHIWAQLEQDWMEGSRRWHFESGRYSVSEIY